MQQILWHECSPSREAADQGESNSKSIHGCCGIKVKFPSLPCAAHPDPQLPSLLALNRQPLITTSHRPNNLIHANDLAYLVRTPHTVQHPHRSLNNLTCPKSHTLSNNVILKDLPAKCPSPSLLLLNPRLRPARHPHLLRPRIPTSPLLLHQTHDRHGLHRHQPSPAFQPGRPGRHAAQTHRRHAMARPRLPPQRPRRIPSLCRCNGKYLTSPLPNHIPSRHRACLKNSTLTGLPMATDRRDIHQTRAQRAEYLRCRVSRRQGGIQSALHDRAERTGELFAVGRVFLQRRCTLLRPVEGWLENGGVAQRGTCRHIDIHNLLGYNWGV